MKFTKRAASVVAFSAALSAAQPAAADTQVIGRIKTINSFTGHSGLLIALDIPYNTGEACGGVVWYIFPDDSVRVAVVQSLLLSSYLNRQPVNLTLRGCHQNYPRIVHVVIDAP